MNCIVLMMIDKRGEGSRIYTSREGETSHHADFNFIDPV